MSGLWRWGDGYTNLPSDADTFDGDKYADCQLYCGEAIVIPIRFDHYEPMWDIQYGDIYPTIEQRAFIARACNCHDELYAALRGMVEAYDLEHEQSPFADQIAAHKAARAVLAKAKGSAT